MGLSELPIWAPFCAWLPKDYIGFLFDCKNENKNIQQQQQQKQLLGGKKGFRNGYACEALPASGE